MSVCGLNYLAEGYLKHGPNLRVPENTGNFLNSRQLFKSNSRAWPSLVKFILSTNHSFFLNFSFFVQQFNALAIYFWYITGLRTYIYFIFPCAQSHPTPSPYFKMLVLSKDQEMIPPVYVIDAHAQKFHIFQLLLLILKAFAQCTPSLHATALTSCIVLCAAAERSVASTNSSATYCQQLPAPHQTRLPPPFHHASHGL